MRKTKQYSLIGGGGFGQEVAAYIIDTNDSGSVDIRFWDDTGAPNSEEGKPWYCAGPIDEISIHSDETVLICVGDCQAREVIADKLVAKSIPLGSYIHPTAVVSSFAKLASGCIVLPFSCISMEAQIGFNTVINSHVGVGHHATIGKHCVVSPQCLIAGRAKIGDSVFMGSSAVITPGKSLGKGSKVAAQSVVYRKYGDGSFLMGNPARKQNKDT